MIEIIFNSFENIFCFVFFWVKFMILCKKIFFLVFNFVFIIVIFVWLCLRKLCLFFDLVFFGCVVMIVSFNCIENCL